ncbi:condensation domain-containing protein, partial [Croceitalea sp. MTPC5]|uniref:condensation domain-containing protein n=1 Tax=Croceitalea sp. MTPC5 TaxID=3056565 RepID=UPI0030D45B99
PLSFSQQRLWFIEQYEGGTNAYHMPSVFELAPGTDRTAVEHALQGVVARHEVLRSTVRQGDGEDGVQVVHDVPLAIDWVAVDTEEQLDSMLQEDIDRPFDLSSDYPIRARFYGLGTDRTFLLVNTHHIASDGWSAEVFLRELFEHYRAHTEDREVSLPVLDIQYRDYALWQRSYLTGKVLE